MGALRKQAEGHDIAIRSMGRGRMETEPLDLGGMAEMAKGR